MPVHVIESMREERAAAYERMKEINDHALEEGRDLSAEEQQEFDRAEQDFDSLGARIQRSEDLEGLAPRMTRSAALPESEAREVETRQERPGPDSEEYAEKFSRYLRTGDEMEARAALQVGTDSEGGYIVPEDWMNRLVEKSREFGVVRSLATVITTSDGRKIHIPTIATFNTAVLVVEEEAFTQSEPTFGEKELDAYKYGTIAKFSDELRQDAMFDIDGLIQRLAGEAITLKEDSALLSGSGSSQPEGLLTGLETGKTAASKTAITADELIDLYHSVTSPYRASASWIFHDKTAAEIRKLKDENQQYLWQPGLQAGAPDLLLGKPVYTDTFMPELAEASKVGVFGDIGRAYTVRNAGGIAVKVLEELYAANGQVGVRVHRRTDGAVVDVNAAKVLKTA